MFRAFLILLISFPVQAKERIYGDAVVSQVTSIYDADTFRVNIKGYPPIAGEHVPIRVSGVDAPEIRGKCESEKLAARKAKQYTVAALRGAKLIELNLD